MRARLGVNIDHVATLRQARGTAYPEPVLAAQLAELAGADQITVHLREDRRHIQDRDVRLLREVVQVPLNLEMALTDEMTRFALDLRPHTVTLVPERREERTTEGGLDVLGRLAAVAAFVSLASAAGIETSLFIAADDVQIEAAAQSGARIIELHTGEYAHAFGGVHESAEFSRIARASAHAASLGMTVAAGHGLEYRNVHRLLGVPEIEEFNIGHSIVARAVLVGFERAVAEMVACLGSGAPRRAARRH
jgi:pyridoxine 5-phosphate synthase